MDPSTVIVTHLSKILQEHAHELLGYEEVQHVLDILNDSAPKLVEGLVPKAIPMATLVRVLQNLLQENTPIKNMRTHAETLAEHSTISQEADALTAVVRVALKR